MAGEIKVLTINEVRQILSMQKTLPLIEEAFAEYGRGEVQLPPKNYLFFTEAKGDLRIMPAYFEKLDKAGVKLVNAHPYNPGHYGLPTVVATILLFDSKTGMPVSIMDGTYITAMRTAAASGVASKYLARSNSKILSIIGAGFQMPYQLEAIAQVFSLERIKIFDMDIEKACKQAEIIREQYALEVEIDDDIEKAVSGADIITTITPSRKPIIKAEWIKEGTHINAVGADAPGKEELAPEILVSAKIVIDDWVQASHGGEINVPLASGKIDKSNIYAEIGEVVADYKPGRVSDDEITIFDTTGLAIQDVITAWYVYETAEKQGIGNKIPALYY